MKNKLGIEVYFNELNGVYSFNCIDVYYCYSHDMKVKKIYARFINASINGFYIKKIYNK